MDEASKQTAIVWNSAWVRYGTAIVTSVLSLLLKLALRRYLGDTVPFILFFTAVMLNAWLGGMGPGLLATTLCTIFAAIFFMGRMDNAHVLGKALPLATFAIEGILISALSDSRKRILKERTAVLRRERAAREHAEHLGMRLSDVLESITDAFITLDSQWRITFANQAASRLFGHAATDLLGTNIWDLFPEAAGTAFYVQAHKAMAERVAVEFEGEYAALNLWLQTKIYPSGNGIAIYSRDMSQRRRDEQALIRSEAHKTAVLRNALDCIISMDHEGKVIEWNPAAEITFGYVRAEVLGREMAEAIIPSSLREAHRSGLLKYLSSGEGPVIGKRIEITGMRKDGSEFPVELSITPVQGQGPPTFTGYLRDITDRKRGETERDRLLLAEREARQDAERANGLKDEFLSIVSHELRTPLNAILGWSQLLSDGEIKQDDLREGLQVIQRNARVQTQIIEDILDMSRIISGRLRLDVQPVNLASVIESAMMSVQPAADAKGIRLQKVLDSSAGLILGDPARLQQIVWNLISNAIKFTPKEGQVWVTLAQGDSRADITVSDTGQGIKPEFLPHVFERFRQGESATTRRHGGLGLGLAIVKQLTELHGGTVDASSPGEGQGATFTITLPVRPQPTNNNEAVVRQPDSKSEQAAGCSAASNLNGISVLLVDDEPDARTLLKKLLESSGARVTTSASVEEALHLVQEISPSVIVSDIGMPGRDGYDFARVLRSFPPENGGRTPAIALTAFARSEDQTRAMIAGFDVHIAKPVEPAELCALISRLAGRESPK